MTVGAETAILENTLVGDNGTVFGSPPVVLYSSKTNEEIVSESQHMSLLLENQGSMHTTGHGDNIEQEQEELP